MANFTTKTPYVVSIGNQNVSFTNAYVQTQLTAGMQMGTFNLTATIWDSQASSVAGSGVLPIGSQTFSFVVSPALAATIVAAVVAADIDPALNTFLSNLTAD